MSPLSAAKKLASMITQAVEEIEADTARQIPGGTTTDINLPVVAPEDDLDITPQRKQAISDLMAATHQLLSTLMPAGLHIQDTFCSYFQAVAIRIVIRGRIADLIHTIDPDSSKGGADVQVLAEKAGMDPSKLTQILRYLALRNIFCELTPNRWGNNRLSIPLRTDSPNTQCNFLGHQGEEIGLPAFVELPNVLFNKQDGAAFSKNYKQSAFQEYYKPDGDFFDFLSKSEGGYRAERFGHAMIEATQATTSGKAQYNTFEWHKLGPKGTLIDVGGGIGAAAYDISNYLPGWNVVVQDRAEVIKQGREIYQNTKSTANLEFEEADFTNNQPPHRIGTADVYFLRHILHDWPFNDCVKILTHLRKAAKETTRLLICETRLEAPLIDKNSPLLSNGGMASSYSYIRDLCMLTLFNAEERSEIEFSRILNNSGWILKESTPLSSILDNFIFEGIPNPEWK